MSPHSQGNSRIILFDIDGTLLKAGGIVRKAMGEALEKVFGTRGGIEDTSFTGATDLGVVHKLMEKEGFATAEIADRFGNLTEVYGPILRNKLSTWNDYHFCPGVPDILDSLKDNGSMLGLVTGNCRVGAQVKLDRGGLGDYFQFGAYGDETRDRAEIARLAHQRGVEKAKKDIPRDSVILVGDSPNDIKAAHDYGIRILAVFSGWTPKEELETLKPTWLYPDMSNIKQITSLLLS